ncbi:LysR family transcriptional regulator [Metabacillus sediminilitoris]|uniref:LysR family transcriptional regulator n=1 Tax=Metabacillus sediminilitoris TaxID=2567941 RepID=A0A4S4BWY4_9BACI|nr:LysR family transcriptional regulator [Metabacillus sediminilitoris]QGQ46015.1 LysR family transcriptional regulator [Metabacillus sediminilitoris]THF79699.1 LysR family transcriptional regulator [Metabacillus sediminilitoris]
MYFDALRTFITVVEEKNFTKAAEKLLLSQPSVSVHIKNLEEEFQTQLLIRSPKMLKLTLSGEMLYERAKQMMQIYENTKIEIYEQQNTIKGTIHIAASFTIGEYILPTLLAKLSKKYPMLDFVVTIGNTDEVVKHVQFFKADIGLIEGNTNEKDLIIQPYMEDELTIIATSDHPLKKVKVIEIEDLQDEIWISRERGSGTREYLEHVIRTNGLKMNRLITISSNQGVKETVMNGLGISILSIYAVKRELEQGTLIQLKPKNELFKRKFSYVVSPMSVEKKNIQLFLETLGEKHG